MSGLDLSRSYERTRQWRILHYSHGRGLSSTRSRIIREVLPAFCVYLISSFKKNIIAVAAKDEADGGMVDAGVFWPPEGSKRQDGCRSELRDV